MLEIEGINDMRKFKFTATTLAASIALTIPATGYSYLVCCDVFGNYVWVQPQVQQYYPQQQYPQNNWTGQNSICSYPEDKIRTACVLKGVSWAGNEYQRCRITFPGAPFPGGPNTDADYQWCGEQAAEFGEACTQRVLQQCSGQ